jgi:hypothetical protein
MRKLRRKKGRRGMFFVKSFLKENKNKKKYRNLFALLPSSFPQKTF